MDGDQLDDDLRDADRREPTMTLSGWRRFVDSPPASFTLLPQQQWQQLQSEVQQRSPLRHFRSLSL